MTLSENSFSVVVLKKKVNKRKKKEKASQNSTRTKDQCDIISIDCFYIRSATSSIYLSLLQSRCIRPCECWASNAIKVPIASSAWSHGSNSI